MIKMRKLMLIIFTLFVSFMSAQNVDIRIKGNTAEIIPNGNEIGVLSNIHFQIYENCYFQVNLDVREINDTLFIPISMSGPIEDFYVSINGEDRTGKILQNVDSRTSKFFWSERHSQWVINRFGKTYNVLGIELY